MRSAVNALFRFSEFFSSRQGDRGVFRTPARRVKTKGGGKKIALQTATMENTTLTGLCDAVADPPPTLSRDLLVDDARVASLQSLLSGLFVRR